jgi:hypothetical protein
VSAPHAPVNLVNARDVRDARFADGPLTRAQRHAVVSARARTKEVERDRWELWRQYVGGEALVVPAFPGTVIAAKRVAEAWAYAFEQKRGRK